jgi:hypothetical protein
MTGWSLVHGYLPHVYKQVCKRINGWPCTTNLCRRFCIRRRDRSLVLACRVSASHLTALLQPNLDFLNNFSPMAQHPLVGQRLFFINASKSHSYTSPSVGLLWTSDRPVANTTAGQHATLTRHAFTTPMGFEPAVPASKQPQTHTLDRVVNGIITNG